MTRNQEITLQADIEASEKHIEFLESSIASLGEIGTNSEIYDEHLANERLLLALLKIKQENLE